MVLCGVGLVDPFINALWQYFAFNVTMNGVLFTWVLAEANSTRDCAGCGEFGSCLFRCTSYSLSRMSGSGVWGLGSGSPGIEEYRGRALIRQHEPPRLKLKSTI